MRTANKIWACESNFLLSYLDTVANAHMKEISQKQSDILFGIESNDETTSSILSRAGNVAFINIKGMLSSTAPNFWDTLFGVQITTFSQIIEAANTALNDDKIKAVQINFDSPGGEVFGTDEAAQAIAELAKQKRVIAINEGIIASGAFWLASQVPEIFSSAPTNMTGSVGVIITSIDRDFDAETPGIKKARIVSRNAPNKVPDLATDEGRSVLQKEADAIERVFISRVASGRRVSEDKVIKDFGRGGLLIAKDPDATKPDAIKTGMIDGLININSSSSAITGVMEATATIEKIENTEDMEDNNMSENTPTVLTTEELRNQQPTAVEAIVKEAKAAERDRIKSIEALMGQVSALPEKIKAQVRKEIDARKFDEGATAEKISVELLSVTSKAQAEFVNTEAATGRAAADTASHVSQADAEAGNLTEEEETKKRRADALEQAAKDLAKKKEAN